MTPLCYRTFVRGTEKKKLKTDLRMEYRFEGFASIGYHVNENEKKNVKNWKTGFFLKNQKSLGIWPETIEI